MKKIILIIVVLLCLPIFIQAVSININTAGSDELEQITGVGPAIAGKIIDYRQTNGLFKNIEEIKNVSGIGDVTFAKMKDQITVGSDVSVDNSKPDVSDNPSLADENVEGSLSAHTSDEDVDSYTKESLKISAGRERLATMRTPILFLASQSKKGKDTNSFTWSFGDGTSAVGAKVYHTYQFPGKYNVVLNGSTDSEEAVARTTVLVIEPKIKVTAVDLFLGFVEITNDSDKEQNLNSWILQTGDKKYVFPVDTIVDSKSSIKVPLNIIGLGGQSVKEITLAYPDGGVVSGARLQEGIDQKKLSELKRQLANLESQIATNFPETSSRRNPVAQDEVLGEARLAGDSKSVVILKKEPGWWEKIKNAIFK